MQVDFFQCIGLFSQASQESLKRLSQIAKRYVYKKDAIVFNHAQSQQTFLYVITGSIKLYKQSIDGEEIIVDVLTQSHYCGENFLFTSSKEYTYEAQSISHLEIFTLPIQSLKQLILSDHNLSLNFLQATLQKQRQLTTHIEHLSTQNAMQRVGSFLLQLCDNTKKQINISLKLPYNKALLALRLGMKPETFSRALGKLSKQCGIQVNNEHINIPDRFNLNQYVCYHYPKTFPCRAER
ncbi:Crp/Fnr family transcriptional regulator [Fastidiosibacter lacustris]|uniref:Crp/Fnr family transcriptional regulator n=1 Tax=Fastidiosibacter lacustris TaxID=2056695 RepID=UPI000E34190B|nr:Crp/Fnr family transcriptional regulator [Fastidiosibacter lacustris]